MHVAACCKLYLLNYYSCHTQQQAAFITKLYFLHTNSQSDALFAWVCWCHCLIFEGMDSNRISNKDLIEVDLLNKWNYLGDYVR